MTIVFSTLASVALVSLISFIGAVSLVISRKRLNNILILMVSFAAGALFGDAVIHLLPESFKVHGANLSTSLLVLAGVLLFFILEKFVRWRHCHVLESGHKHHSHPVATMNLIGDGFHNLLDGILIGSAYLVSMPVGIATTLAVILHEIPSEIGDFGVLIHSGMSESRALFYNFITALTAVVGAVIALAIGGSVAGFASVVLPVAAGGFLYIAGSDLIPELHHDTDWKKSLQQLFALILGIAVMAALTFIE